MRPFLILIHGLPATGKTTLGEEVAKELGLPFFCRDHYKEELFEILGEKDSTTDWSRKLGAASFLVTYLTAEKILTSGMSCVAETYWTPEYAEPKLSDIAERTSARIIQVFCSSDEAVRKERFEKRAETDRHPAHMDTKRLEEGALDNNWAHSAKNVPLRVPCDLIRVDTTEFSKLEVQAVVRQVRDLMNES